MKCVLLLGCTGLALIAATTSAPARVTRIEITKQEPFAAGQTFATVGAYEKVVGRFRGELDPKSPLNAVIVDLDKAPRNARGMVEYSADFYIIKPVDLARRNATSTPAWGRPARPAGGPARPATGVSRLKLLARPGATKSRAAQPVGVEESETVQSNWTPALPPEVAARATGVSGWPRAYAIGSTCRGDSPTHRRPCRRTVGGLRAISGRPDGRKKNGPSDVIGT